MSRKARVFSCFRSTQGYSGLGPTGTRGFSQPGLWNRVHTHPLISGPRIWILILIGLIRIIFYLKPLIAEGGGGDSSPPPQVVIFLYQKNLQTPS